VHFHLFGIVPFPFFFFFSNVIQNKTVPLHFLQLSNNSLQLASKVIAIYVYNKSKQHPKANYVFLNSIQQLSKFHMIWIKKIAKSRSDPKYIYIYIYDRRREKGKKFKITKWEWQKDKNPDNETRPCIHHSRWDHNGGRETNINYTYKLAQSQRPPFSCVREKQREWKRNLPGDVYFFSLCFCFGTESKRERR